MLIRTLLALAVLSPFFCLAPFDATQERVVAGRLLDATGRPLANEEVRVQLAVRIDSSSSSRGSTLRTDEQGCFRHAVGLWNADSSRRLVLSHAGSEVESAAEAMIDISRHIEHGMNAVGDVTLYVPESPTRWTGFSNDELDRQWERWWRLGDRREQEGILREMGRRGGARWVARLFDLHTELGEAGAPWDWRELRPCSFRALRIAQGRRDPLQLEVDTQGPIECVFPELPVIRWSLVNADESESLSLTHGGSYRSGRFARIRVEMVRADGLVADRFTLPTGMGGGLSTTMTLAPGERWGGATDLASYIEPPLAGAYATRIVYHDDRDIDTRTDARAWMVVESAPFDIRIEPRVVRISRAAHGRHLRDVVSIDTTRKVLLTSATWHPEMTFEGAPESPEDRLFRAGWDALPALLEVLAAPDVEHARVDWILGLCFDLTGFLKPGNLGTNVIESHEWVGRWPTSKGQPVRRFGEWNVESGPAPAEARERYITRWLAMRASVLVEFTD